MTGFAQLKDTLSSPAAQIALGIAVGLLFVIVVLIPVVAQAIGRECAIRDESESRIESASSEKDEDGREWTDFDEFGSSMSRCVSSAFPDFHIVQEKK